MKGPVDESGIPEGWSAMGWVGHLRRVAYHSQEPRRTRLLQRAEAVELAHRLQLQKYVPIAEADAGRGGPGARRK